MVKWKLFRRTETEKKTPAEQQQTEQEKSDETTKNITNSEIKQDKEESETIEYHETLYSKGHAPKKTKVFSEKEEKPCRRSSWENMNTIEKNIDTIDKKKTSTTSKARSAEISNIDNKVDKLLTKKKK